MGDGSPSRLNPKGKVRAPYDGDVLALDLGLAEEGTGSSQNGGAFMQMQLVEQQVRIHLQQLGIGLTCILCIRTVIYSHVRPP